MGPKPKRQKRIDALARMERKGPRVRTTETDAEYGVYLHRRLDEIANLEHKIRNGR